VSRRLVLFLAVGVYVASSNASAHHSFAGYVAQKTATIEGEVLRFSLRNPHTFLEITAAESGGQREKWLLEWGSVEQLRAGGIDKSTLKAGDHVVITGNPRRDPAERRLRLLKIVRPSDGWMWKSDGYIG
jgi:uncharacterized protein DUF6152